MCTKLAKKEAPARIQQLPTDVINHIAAGEVITGPTSALKELLDNAIDARATRISIHLQEAGRVLLSVSDNGCGIPDDQLSMAFKRHATSKLPQHDLLTIHHLGFRGEALAAIAMMSAVTLTSRTQAMEHGFCFCPQQNLLKPVKAPIGTTVCMENLFSETPARLKFMKSVRSDRLAIKQLLLRYVMAFPALSLEASEKGKVLFSAPALATSGMPVKEKELRDHLAHRIKTLWPDIPCEHLHWVDNTTSDYRLQGFMASPAYHTPSTNTMLHSVRGRPVKDLFLQRMIRLAYGDTLPKGRFPFVALHLDMAADKVDVNVHPAKETVRFAEPTFLQGWLLRTLRAPLSDGVLALQPNTRTATKLLEKKHTQVSEIPLPLTEKTTSLSSATYTTHQTTENHAVASEPFVYHTTRVPSIPAGEKRGYPEENNISRPVTTIAPLSESNQHLATTIPKASSPSLGQAIAQLHKRYILAESDAGLVLVDQHAAHERLTFERMKKKPHLDQSEALLTPLIITVCPAAFLALESALPTLKHAGLHLEKHGPCSFALYTMPVLLKTTDASTFLNELGAALETCTTNSAQKLAFQDMLQHALGNHACKNSIKGGKPLSLGAMNALLRDIEQTPKAGQCNHGRPTYVVLKRADIDKLFERT